MNNHSYGKNRDSSVGIATGCGLQGWGLISAGVTDFPSLHSAQTASRTHTASYLMSTGGLSQAIKRLRCEVDHCIQYEGQEWCRFTPFLPKSLQWSGA
jgi:hypothetical protein